MAVFIFFYVRSSYIIQVNADNIKIINININIDSTRLIKNPLDLYQLEINSLSWY